MEHLLWPWRCFICREILLLTIVLAFRYVVKNVRVDFQIKKKIILSGVIVRKNESIRYLRIDGLFYEVYQFLRI